MRKTKKKIPIVQIIQLKDRQWAMQKKNKINKIQSKMINKKSKTKRLYKRIEKNNKKYHKES